MRTVATALVVLMENMMVGGKIINNNQIFQARLWEAGVHDRATIFYSIC